MTSDKQQIFSVSSYYTSLYGVIRNLMMDYVCLSFYCNQHSPMKSWMRAWKKISGRDNICCSTLDYFLHTHSITLERFVTKRKSQRLCHYIYIHSKISSTRKRRNSQKHRLHKAINQLKMYNAFFEFFVELSVHD